MKEDNSYISSAAEALMEISFKVCSFAVNRVKLPFNSTSLSEGLYKPENSELLPSSKSGRKNITAGCIFLNLKLKVKLLGSLFHLTGSENLASEGI